MPDPTLELDPRMELEHAVVRSPLDDRDTALLVDLVRYLFHWMEVRDEWKRSTDCPKK